MEKSPRPTEAKDSANSARPERDEAKASPRNYGKDYKVSPRGSARESPRGSARGNEVGGGGGEGEDPQMMTQRSQGTETFRSTMSTARVHTALAALAAEKQALIAKLNTIDNALEGERRKTGARMRK